MLVLLVVVAQTDPSMAAVRKNFHYLRATKAAPWSAVHTVRSGDAWAAPPRHSMSASGTCRLAARTSKKSAVRSREARARAAAHPHMSWWWSLAAAAPRAGSFDFRSAVKYQSPMPRCCHQP